MRVLMIEDNKELACNVKLGLEKEGLVIDIANNAEDGDEKAFVNDYDVILLDLNLPDKDGIEMLEFFRKNKLNTPIIIVTARDGVNELAKGLDLGADDYIVKPFQIIELRARIQAVIRRFYGRTNPTIEVGPLSIHPSSRKVYVYGEEVKLGTKEFDILEYIASRNPDIVSAIDIAEHVYDEYFDPLSSVLRVHIARLKKKLKEVSGKEILITTRGIGYSICEK
ncbi:response regulator transcription factor [Paraclostridium sordellii]|uniref:response regulator transcription factor n=1 Tax=Paraclostridium sordellii TaxID=1505 RepID=UPI0005E3C7A9|nr:response regulator transcription factor [Paeniclostridium sordellii]CEO20991.1 DNA-binding response regulator [[Clostridium] sordellii] [Paeniclostridium sordellii]